MLSTLRKHCHQLTQTFSLTLIFRDITKDFGHISPDKALEVWPIAACDIALVNPRVRQNLAFAFICDNIEGSAKRMRYRTKTVERRFRIVIDRNGDPILKRGSKFAATGDGDVMDLLPAVIDMEQKLSSPAGELNFACVPIARVIATLTSSNVRAAGSAKLTPWDMIFPRVVGRHK